MDLDKDELEVTKEFIIKEGEIKMLPEDIINPI